MITDNTQKQLFSLSDTDLEDGEIQSFMMEVGTLVFQSALMKYLAIEPEEKTREFEVFINLQVNSDNFMIELQKKYPDFTSILEEEMQAFQSEVNELAL